jgi:hypothetical protein
MIGVATGKSALDGFEHLRLRRRAMHEQPAHDAAFGCDERSVEQHVELAESPPLLR